MELTVLSEAQISELPISEQERKSNEAFAKLASIIKHYNDGWEPSKGDLGYLVYSRRLLLLWGEVASYGPNGGLGYTHSHGAFSLLTASVGARIAIKDYDLCKFMAEKYEKLYKDLWMEE